MESSNLLLPISRSQILVATDKEDCTLPVLAAQDDRLRWNKEAIQFKTDKGMRHLDWQFVKDVKLDTERQDVTFYDRPIRITDRSGKIHKILLSDFSGVLEVNNFFHAARTVAKVLVQDLTLENYENMKDCVITLWPHNEQGADVKRTQHLINTVMILFAVGWIFSVCTHLGSDCCKVFGNNSYFLMQFVKVIPLMLIPLYAKLVPISQIRITPKELRCEAIIGGKIVVKKKIEWHQLSSIDLTEEKPNQRLTDRQLVFQLKKRGAYKVKLEQISTAHSWKNLLRGLFQYSRMSIESLDQQLFDNINLDQNDPTYTQVWLDSLTAPAQREKLIPLQSGIALQDGKYVLDRKLGAGGQGSAYLAHTANGANVVLKEYILPIFVDAKVRRKALENFEHEARMLQQLNSPSIVKLSDFFIEDHRGYLVLEHINGPNLRDYVQAHGPLSEAKTIEYGIALCDVLTHLHGQDPPIIHRDFTPDNVILCADDTLKVIDFMVAQRNDETATATVVGKHAYLPPEQFRGKANKQSDIYALGCSMFFLLTGQDPEPLSSSNPILITDTVSGALDQIVAKATAVELDERFKSAAELKHALQEARHEIV